MPKTRSSASSHDRILLAAKHLFATRGYENTSTLAIARQAGTSESQLMKHFGSKEGLLEAIFDHAWQRINVAVRDAIERSGPPVQKLNALADVLLRMMESDPDLKVLMLLEGRRIRGEGHLVVLTRGFREFIALLDGLLRQMRKEGRIRKELQPEALRSALMGAYEGLMRDQLLARRMGFPAHYGPRQVRALFAAFWSAFLVPRAAKR